MDVSTTMKTKNGAAKMDGKMATPITNQRGRTAQAPRTVVPMAIGVSEEARQENCAMLNTLLADTIQIASLYKKAHWQAKGHTFYQLHLLFDEHYEKQTELTDLIAERIQMLGGVAEGMPGEVVANTRIENPPSAVLLEPDIMSRLLEAHTAICAFINEGIDKTDENKDWGTNDLLMSDVLRENQKEYWFVSQHLIETPLVEAGGDANR